MTAALEVSTADLMSTLVDRARAGDREAFGQIWSHYYGDILGFITFLCRNRQLAEDLTSETFTRALAGIGRFRWQGRNFDVWLRSIARNIVADHNKSLYARRSVAVDMAQHQHHDADTDRRCDPEQVAEHNNASEQIDELLRLLRPDQRRVLAYRIGEELTVAQTAAVMQISDGAVKSLQFRAVHTLRQVFAENADPQLTERC